MGGEGWLVGVGWQLIQCAVMGRGRLGVARRDGNHLGGAVGVAGSTQRLEVTIASQGPEHMSKDSSIVKRTS